MGLEIVDFFYYESKFIGRVEVGGRGDRVDRVSNFFYKEPKSEKKRNKKHLFFGGGGGGGVGMGVS